MIVQMIQNLENKMDSQINRLEAWIKKMKEMFDKVLDLESMILNCGAGQDSWESLGQQKIKPVNPKGNQSWIFIGRTNVEAPILWSPDMKSWLTGKDPDAGKRLRATGEGDNRGWDGWMASLTWWTWVWANSGRQWGTGKPSMLQVMGWQNQIWLSDWTTTTKMN